MNEWKDAPDSEGDWVVKHDDEPGSIVPLDANLCDPKGASWDDWSLTSGNSRWLKPPPEVPPLRPGLLRWRGCTSGEDGAAVLWPDGRVSVQRTCSHSHFETLDNCREAGYELTQDA